MMLQGLFLFFLTFFFWLLEGSFFSHWTVWGIKPDLILILLVLTLLYRGTGYGLFVSITGGLLMDSYLMSQGFSTLFYLAVTFFLSPFLVKIEEDGMVLALLVMVVTTLQNIFFFLWLLASGTHPSVFRLIQVVPAQILFNLLLLIICYVLFRYFRILINLFRKRHGDSETTTY